MPFYFECTAYVFAFYCCYFCSCWLRRLTSCFFGFIISVILCQWTILGWPSSMYTARNVRYVWVSSSDSDISALISLPCHHARTSAKSVLRSNLIEKNTGRVLECRCVAFDDMVWNGYSLNCVRSLNVLMDSPPKWYRYDTNNLWYYDGFTQILSTTLKTWWLLFII